MKLTESKLRQIIRQEARRMSETTQGIGPQLDNLIAMATRSFPSLLGDKLTDPTFIADVREELMTELDGRNSFDLNVFDVLEVMERVARNRGGR